MYAYSLWNFRFDVVSFERRRHYAYVRCQFSMDIVQCSSNGCALVRLMMLVERKNCHKDSRIPYHETVKFSNCSFEYSIEFKLEMKILWGHSVLVLHFRNFKWSAHTRYLFEIIRIESVRLKSFGLYSNTFTLNWMDLHTKILTWNCF